MGNIFGGGKSTTTTNSSQVPWDAQQPYILPGFKDAQDLYNKQRDIGPYTGQLYAPITQPQQQASDYLTGTAAPNTQQIANTFAGVGNGLAGGLGTAQGVANNFATGNFAQNITAPGYQAAATIPQSMALGQGALGTALRAENGSPIASDMAGASAYANNPTVDGMVNSALTDVSRNLNENTLPSLNAQAIAGGGLNSSRAGAASAIAQRSADELAANTAANIRGNAYNTGAQLAENGRVANMNAANTTGSAASYMANTGLNGMSLGNTGNTSNNATMLSGNGQLTGLGQLGLSTLGASPGMANTAAGQLLQGGGILQQNQQNQDNADQQAYNNKMQFPWQELDNYWGIVGKPLGYNSSSTSTSQQSGNPLGGILGLASLVAAPFTGGGSGGGGSLLGNLGSGIGSLGTALGGSGALSNAFTNLGGYLGGTGTIGDITGATGGANTLANMGFYNPLN